MPYFAIDAKGQRIYIENAHVKEHYYCEICKEPFIVKRGVKIAHHFAHYPHCSCKDNWHYEEMSLWHKAWQERFPLECREVVKEFGNKIHRADVLLEKSKTVIEFQHSDISQTEFEDRNEFYASFGYRVIWLFDCMELFKVGAISNLRESSTKYKWLNPLRTFNSFEVQNKEKVTLFFQRAQDPIKLERIVWVAPSGFERFCAEFVDLDQFMAFALGKKIEEKFAFPKNSICEISQRYKTTLFIVKNQQTEDKVMIVQDPIEQVKKYHRVYGKTEDTFGDFKKETEEIKDFNEPIWKLVWKKPVGISYEKKKGRNI